MAKAPCKSMICVFLSASFCMSASLPKAKIRSPTMAIAVAFEFSESAVKKLPLMKMRLGAADGLGVSEQAAISSAKSTRVRICFMNEWWLKWLIGLMGVYEG